MSDTVLDRLEQLLDHALAYDGNAVAGPIALFWPDKGRQWDTVVGALQGRRRIIRYGDFDPATRQGPAYWLRCVIAATIDLGDAPGGVPIVYLPEFSRDDLRTIETAPSELAPLAALQYRSKFFGNSKSNDWTVRALFENPQAGLGLSLAKDEGTSAALLASLSKLIDQPLARLETKHLDAAFLNALVNPDPVRTLLEWLDDPKGMRERQTAEAWAAFVQQCQDEFAFNAATEGEIQGARRLGEAEGAWAQVWRRFRESPRDYPGIPDRLRQAQSDLLPKHQEAWPAIAEAAEDRLRKALVALGTSSPAQAREELLILEAEHKERRGYVWAELEWTPLALALEHLAEAARATSSGPSGDSVAAIADWYAAIGWHADRAVLGALDEVDRKVDVQAVESAIVAVYRPWLDATAKALQSAVGPAANAGTYVATPCLQPGDGEVIVFVDGLRLDIAHLLEDRLLGAGLETSLSAGLAALPTVTQTAKPVLVPIDQNLLSGGSGFDARRAPDGPAAGVQVLRALMTKASVQVLSSEELGVPVGTAWTEAGEIDSRGHSSGIGLAHEIEDLVGRIATRIEELLDSGWTKATVVTDHGWLLLPGGLPKNEDLPAAATEEKKGRCARIKDGAVVSVPTVPWHWDKDVRIAVAPGITDFTANQTYEHGGVSPQECVVPRLTVSRGETSAVAGVAITKTKWRGLTLVVEVTNLPDGAAVDLRTAAGDANSSIAERARVTDADGRALLLVGDEDREGQSAQIVVVGADGSVLLQRETTVGQNR